MKLLLETLSNKQGLPTPIWFMRQAGRYLPEYLELRKTTPNFLDFCYDPKKACEAALQPLRRFDLDASILFSDILVIPHALGQEVTFEKNIGPKLKPITKIEDLKSLRKNESILNPIFETVSNIKHNLKDHQALIGFSGSPWTLACYMINGQGSRDYANVREIALKDPNFFDYLMNTLIEIICNYLSQQIQAGAEVIQLFDSWAGVLSEKLFLKYSLEPNKKIIAYLKNRHPQIPIIGFPKGVGQNILEFTNQTQADAVGLDSSFSINWINQNLNHTVTQGNLDNISLLVGGEQMEQDIINIKKIKSPHIFNLGHGILPTTPIKNVEKMIEMVKGII